jgi:hypothetical protein
MATKDLETPVAKISLEDIASGYASTALLNDNFELIADALNNDVLYRANPVGEANQMSNQLDMNSNRITNLAAATEASDAVTYGQLVLAAGPDTATALRADLIASTGTDLVGYGSRTLTDRLNDIVSVAQFPGFDATGVADSTAAVQAAVVYAEALNTVGPVEIRFPAGAIVNLKMVFVTTGGINLNGNGCKIVQSHDSVNSTTVDGPGTYKVSAAFFIKRGATDVEITGFDFTTNDASFPAVASGYGSYFPSIGGHHFTRLYIHNNRFRGGQDRFLFTQAGKYCRVENNNIENNGSTIHIGYAGNVYFYDEVTDVNTKFSPIAPSIVNNVFDGFDSDRSTTVLHLTGATEFVVNNNKFRNISLGDAGNMRVIQLYSNDFGPFDEDGNALAEIQGVCCGNFIEGTFTHGINVDGESELGLSTWTSSFQMRILVEGNKYQRNW